MVDNGDSRDDSSGGEAQGSGGRVGDIRGFGVSGRF
jgi:hypothetical protein